MVEVLSTFKKIIVFDILIGILGIIIVEVISKSNNYTGEFLLGLFLGAAVFFILGIISANILVKRKKKSLKILTAINFLKPLIICIIGIIIFNNNINNMISYIMGFTSHIIAIIAYGIFNLFNERK
ncbi:hypothetical protein [Clostridium prolinivorans]|uniref:hypothetical protein n=1 Tax=Clostridium prolinivorans TaxID=2769420 RepID=UPI000FDA5C86|nr:hypothetical protein [Clostridium prolinivorans]